MSRPMAVVIEVGRWDCDSIRPGTSELIIQHPIALLPRQHQTAAHFGVRVTQDDISREKAKGNANNDWVSRFRERAAHAPGARVSS